MAFVVEDGTGKPDATSYVEVAFADDYFADRMVEAWNDADDAEKRAALIRAAAGLDAKYAGRWPGKKRHATQKRAWPRSERTGEDLPLFDADGAELPTDAVPSVIMEAACEVALIELSERFIAQSVSRDQLVKRKKTDVLETEYFDGVQALAAGKQFPHIDNLLQGIALAANVPVVHMTPLLTEREATQGDYSDPFADPRYFERG